MAYLKPVYDGLRLLHLAAKGAKRLDVELDIAGEHLLVRGVYFNDLAPGDRRRLDSMGWTFDGPKEAPVVPQDGAEVAGPGLYQAEVGESTQPAWARKI